MFLVVHTTRFSLIIPDIL